MTKWASDFIDLHRPHLSVILSFPYTAMCCLTPPMHKSRSPSSQYLPLSFHPVDIPVASSTRSFFDPASIASSQRFDRPQLIGTFERGHEMYKSLLQLSLLPYFLLTRPLLQLAGFCQLEEKHFYVSAKSFYEWYFFYLSVYKNTICHS